MIATGLCVLGVAFWTLPGGIIGSGFAFKIEEKNKIKRFNRLLPAAAAYIQTWWRLKVMLDIPPEKRKIDRLIAVLKVFHPKEIVDETGAKIKVNKKIIGANNYYDTFTSFNDEKLDERENFLREALDDKNDSENLEFLLKKLHPKNLVVIRSILLIKFFSAQHKFKFAHKPYEITDVCNFIHSNILKFIFFIFIGNGTSKIFSKLDYLNDYLCFI
jgi:hypothetical protein